LEHLLQAVWFRDFIKAAAEFCKIPFQAVHALIRNKVRDELR
jgi:hypothetical protein